MVSETVFYMDIEEAGTVRGEGELFFYFWMTRKMFGTGFGFRR